MTVDEATALVAADPLGDRIGPATDHPVITVDATSGSEDRLAVLGALLTPLPVVAVVVGTDSPATTAFDVVAGPDEGEAIDTSVRTNPLAALVLVQLVRASHELPVGDALAAESMAYGLLQAGAEHRAWAARQPEREGREPAGRPPVRVERVGDAVTITLDRPEIHNAYGSELRESLCDALTVTLLDDSIDQVDLDGTGPSFCSGGDLAEFGTVPDVVIAHEIRTRRNAGRLLAELTARLGERVTVHLHGSCIGAGIELAAFAGRVVAAPDTVLRLPEIAMGLVPGAGGTVSIPRRIGRQRFCAMALAGAAVDAEQALAWGLVDDVPAST